MEKYVDVATDKQGNIYVSMYGSGGMVEIYDAEMHKKSEFFSLGGLSPSEMEHQGWMGTDPRIYVDEKGYLYAAFIPGNVVRVYDQEKAHILRIGSYLEGRKLLRKRPGLLLHDIDQPHLLNEPNDVAVDENGTIYVCCGDIGLVHAVQAFDSHGRYLFSLASLGTAGERFGAPKGITIDKKRRLVVVEFLTDRLQVFDASGKFLQVVGKQGTGIGEFGAPADLCCDEEGNLYVADYGNHRIQKFDSDLKPVLTFGEKGRDVGQLFEPSAIAYHPQGYLLIIDARESRIQLFDLNGHFLRLLM